MKKLKLITVLMLCASMLAGCTLQTTYSFLPEDNPGVKISTNEEDDSSSDDGWFDFDDEDDGETDLEGEEYLFEKPKELDYWGFENSACDIANGLYYMTDEDRVRLCNNLYVTDARRIAKMMQDNLDDYNAVRKGEMKKEDAKHLFGGSCQGLAITDCLAYLKGYYPVNKNGKTTSLKDALPTKDIVSYINYYYYQQNTAPIIQYREYFATELDEKEQMQRLLEVASQNTPFLIGYNYLDHDGNVPGHAVAGCGLESEGWFEGPSGTEQSLMIYKYRVPLYDSNTPGKERFLYFNLDGTWCIPDLDLYSQSTHIYLKNMYDNACLNMILSSEDYLNICDYKTGAKSDVYCKTGGSVPTTVEANASSDFHISTPKGSADILNGQIQNSTFGEDELCVVVESDGPSGGNMVIYLPEGEQYYEITSSSDIDATFSSGDYYAELNTDAAGMVKIGKDASVQIECKDESADIEVSCLDSERQLSKEEGTLLTVTQKNASNLNLSPSASGIEIEGEEDGKISFSTNVNG